MIALRFGAPMIWRAGRHVVDDVAVRIGLVVAGSDPLGPNDLDPDDVRDLACDATSSDRICRPPRQPEPTPRDVGDGGSSGFGAFASFLVILLVVALVLALGWLLWQFLDGRTMRSTAETDDEELDEEEDLDESLGPRIVDGERPPDRWRRAAAAHRAAGEYRESVRCEYRALVGDLARAGYVDEIPGRTSGEERGQVRAIAPDGSTVPAAFDEAAECFDVAWFDDGTVTAGDDERFVSVSTVVLDQVVARVGSRRAR
ncbi:MAG: DUF4129 domain-containing protein [Actinomycetota bacterium]